MRKDVLVVGGTAVVLVAAVVLGASYYGRSQQAAKEAAATKAPPPEASLYVRPHSHSLGPQDAKVTVVEFLDPECESCRAMYPMVKQILNEYSGRVRLVVRYMPFHGNSMYAAAALEAAGEQGKYWELLESLFVNQPQWGSHHDPRPQLIPELAKRVGLDMAAFGKSISSGDLRPRIEQDQADGKALGVTGTPTFFVNGKMLEQLGYEQLRALINAELAK
jgi:protein-disulfide isomerase